MVSGMNSVGLASDEAGDGDAVTAQLEGLAYRLEQGVRLGLRRPATFLGVGGRLIFRDLVYRMEPIFRADRDHYREHDLLRYPYMEPRTRLQKALMAVGTMTAAGRKMIYRRIPEIKVAQLQKVVERA